MNKLIKSLIVINGIIIPLVLGIIIFEWLKPKLFSEEFISEGIIVDERLDEAKSDSLALQGLFYDDPIAINNSSNFYLPISVTTFQNARDLRQARSSAGDIPYSFYQFMNVIFLDKNYEVITTLVNEKASITEIEIPYKYNQDKTINQTIKNIAYLIGFKDTNKDGHLNYLDHHDLYITDLNGQNLIRATTDIDIVSFEFIKLNTQIMVRYKDRSEIREEHKRIKFGLFDIRSAQFSELKHLNDSIDQIEKRLIE